MRISGLTGGLAALLPPCSKGSSKDALDIGTVGDQIFPCKSRDWTELDRGFVVLMARLGRNPRRIDRRQAFYPFFKRGLLLGDRSDAGKIGSVQTRNAFGLFNPWFQLLNPGADLVGFRPAVAPRSCMQKPPAIRLDGLAIFGQRIEQSPSFETGGRVLHDVPRPVGKRPNETAIAALMGPIVAHGNFGDRPASLADRKVYSLCPHRCTCSTRDRPEFKPGGYVCNGPPSGR